ncbi:DUF397 domain-containing protein [Streptomyces paromomycinus]|uniref:DUF397 domain-containing protein n=1 Tax=Streptomyces paromomycinus TaxID=92743 RepID=A0A401W792_STREY|nr:DUF397 domain-containing protein [Streptomyces paromomycinus]GCD45207.1 hypothetical protein GKJPGBOP_04929 [Streptomyces paromomycinus]
MKIGPTRWVKSSYTSAEGGNCVEWSPSTAEVTGIVPVRDSKDPHGPVLTFPAHSFADFIVGVKNDAFSALRQ